MQIAIVTALSVEARIQIILGTLGCEKMELLYIFTWIAMHNSV